MITELIQEEFEEYQAWEKEFFKDKNYRQVATKEWFKTVQNSHKDIRNLLNGFGCEIEIQFNNINRKLSDDIFNPIKDKLLKILPSIKYDIEDLLNKDLDALKLPSIPTDGIAHRNIKSSTFILNCAKKNSIDNKPLVEILNELGKYWNLFSTKEANAKIIITTEAREFVKLGFNKMDSMSCFKNGDAKYILGTGKDSFILHYYEEDKHVARMWGSFTQKCSVMNLCNLYIDKGMHEGNALTAAKILYANLADIDPDDVIESHDLYVPHNMYKNAYGTLSFSKEKIDCQDVKFNKGNIQCYTMK